MTHQAASDQSVSDVAQAYSDHLSGTEYGHQGKVFHDADLHPEAARYVRSAVSLGKNAAIARREHDEARSAYFRDSFRKSLGIAKHYGVSSSQMESAYSIGYRS